MRKTISLFASLLLLGCQAPSTSAPAVAPPGPTMLESGAAGALAPAQTETLSIQVKPHTGSAAGYTLALYNAATGAPLPLMASGSEGIPAVLATTPPVTDADGQCTLTLFAAKGLSLRIVATQGPYALEAMTKDGASDFTVLQTKSPLTLNALSTLRSSFMAPLARLFQSVTPEVRMELRKQAVEKIAAITAKLEATLEKEPGLAATIVVSANRSGAVQGILEKSGERQQLMGFYVDTMKTLSEVLKDDAKRAANQNSFQVPLPGLPVRVEVAEKTLVLVDTYTGKSSSADSPAASTFVRETTEGSSSGNSGGGGASSAPASNTGASTSIKLY